MADQTIPVLKDNINANIKSNTSQSITGDSLNKELIDSVDTLVGEIGRNHGVNLAYPDLASLQAAIPNPVKNQVGFVLGEEWVPSAAFEEAWMDVYAYLDDAEIVVSPQ